MTRLLRGLGAATWLAAALLLLPGCGQDEATPGVDAAPAETARPSPTAPERVTVAQVEAVRLQALITASGSVEARRETAVGAGVSGRLERVYVDVGEEVAEGDPLFQIDRRSYEMALAEAEAGLALARAESANAREELRRAQKLVEREVVSDQRLDSLETAAAVARARVEQGKARVERARHDLDRTLVRAPYPASVVERRADEGTLAGPEPILVLQETGTLEAVLDVPEASPVPVRQGDPVELLVEGLTEPISGEVARVSRRVDPQTRTYEVRCEIADASDVVKAGSYVRARLHPTRREALPVVPRSALLARDGRSYLLVVRGDVVEHAPVRAGILTEERAEILSGIRVGDTVVTGDAVERLAHGTRVTKDGEGIAAAPASPGAGGGS